MKPSVLVALAFSLSACAPLTYTQLNQRQVRSISGEPGELHSAVLVNAREQGWTITKTSHSLVVALTPVESGGGMTTRDQWNFLLEEGRVSAQLIPQFKKGKMWKSTDQVSEGYSYARENFQLDKISTLVGENEAVAALK